MMMWEADKITEIFLLAPFNTTSGEGGPTPVETLP